VQHATINKVWYVVFYESADNMLSLAREHFPAHRAWWDTFLQAGTLTGIGTFGDPQTQGAMALFTTRAAAEEFATGDPFVRNGVIRSWYIRDWDDALSRG
jgi:uncharacterized protein YciI